MYQHANKIIQAVSFIQKHMEVIAFQGLEELKIHYLFLVSCLLVLPTSAIFVPNLNPLVQM